MSRKTLLLMMLLLAAMQANVTLSKPTANPQVCISKKNGGETFYDKWIFWTAGFLVIL